MEYNMESLYQQTQNMVSKASQLSYSGPSMLTADEKAFYYFLGSTVLNFDGVIVDAGCWLGSSSFYLGMGIQQSSKFTGAEIIYACDIFRWDKNHDQQIKKHSISLKENDDFQFLTNKFLESLKVKVITKKVDYSISPTETQYHTGEPIEALMVDAGKTPELFFNILEGYLPYCIEDKSFIFFQDYRDYFCWFIPPVVSFLDDILEPVVYLKNGGAGFRFRNKRRVLERLKEAKVMFMNDALLEKYYDKATDQIGSKHPEVFYQLNANKVALFLHQNHVTEAYFKSSENMHSVSIKNENVELFKYLKRIDSSWPVRIHDSSVQNAYRRILHGVTGKKDLKLTYISIHSIKRRVLNPIYTKIFLKKLLR